MLLFSLVAQVERFGDRTREAKLGVVWTCTEERRWVYWEKAAIRCGDPDGRSRKKKKKT